MAKFAHYGDGGEILGFYDDKIHAAIPKPCLEISLVDWQRHVDGDVVLRVNAKKGNPVFTEYVAPRPSASEITLRRGVEVSAECRRRIYAVASAETQINMAMATAVISGKSASSRTSDEKTILVGAEAAAGWVADMRGAVTALVADADTDFTADAAWPEVPPETLAIIQYF